MIIKLKKNQRQNENLKISKRKEALTIYENPHNAIRGFLSRNLQARKEWDDTFKVIKGGKKKKDCQPTTPCLANLSFRNEDRKDFPWEFPSWRSG